jgi:hypothetical protein
VRKQEEDKYTEGLKEENTKCHHENVRFYVYLVPEICADLAVV